MQDYREHRKVRGQETCPPLHVWTCAVLPYPILLSAVSREVVHGDLHTLALLQFAQRVRQQVKVEGVRVVEVVVVTGGPSLLLRGEDLHTGRGQSLYTE